MISEAAIVAVESLTKYMRDQGLVYEEVRLYDDALIGAVAFRRGTTLQNQATEVSEDVLMCASQQHQMVYGAAPITRIARTEDSYDLVFPTPWAARPLVTIWSSQRKEVLLAIPVWSFEGMPNATAKLVIDAHVAWRKALDKLDKRHLHAEFAGRLGNDFARRHDWRA